MSIGLIRRAMAHRVKYRLTTADGSMKRRMPLSLIWVHPTNRGGVYCMEQTVQNLGLGLLVKGISAHEANHEGVYVQELPPEEQVRDPQDPTKLYVTYKEMNYAKCSGTQLLRT